MGQKTRKFQVSRKNRLRGDLLELPSPQKWKKCDVVFVFQYPLHGGNLVIYCHKNSVFGKRQIGIAFLYVIQDVNNSGFLCKGNPNLVGASLRSLEAQEVYQYIHDQFSAKDYLKQLKITVRSTPGTKDYALGTNGPTVGWALPTGLVSSCQVSKMR